MGSQLLSRERGGEALRGLWPFSGHPPAELGCSLDQAALGAPRVSLLQPSEPSQPGLSGPVPASGLSCCSLLWPNSHPWGRWPLLASPVGHLPPCPLPRKWCSPGLASGPFPGCCPLSHVALWAPDQGQGEVSAPFPWPEATPGPAPQATPPSLNLGKRPAGHS